MKVKQPLIILFASLFFLMLSCNESEKDKPKNEVQKQLADDIFYLNLKVKNNNRYQPIHIDVVNRFAIFSKVTYEKSQITQADFIFEQVKEIKEDPSQMFRFELKEVKYMEGPYDDNVKDMENVDHTLVFTIDQVQGREPSHNYGPYKFKSFDIKKGEVVDIIIRSNYDAVDHINKEGLQNIDYFVDLGNHICRSIVNDDD